MSTLPSGVNPRQPVIIGVGQAIDRPDPSGTPAAELPERPSPAGLMEESLRAALADTGTDPSAVAGRLDRLASVPTLTWRYGDAARVVAEALGTAPTTVGCTMGGQSPNQLLGEACRAIHSGASEVAAVIGGEAGYTRASHRRAGTQPTWPSRMDGAPNVMVGDPSAPLAHEHELAHGLVMPTQMYPLFETAVRAAAGRSLAEHQAYVGELWAGFSSIAADNPFAWDRTAHSAEEITTATTENRWVGWPYTRHMVSNPQVDLGASFVVAAAEAAAQLGVPEDRWIHVRSVVDGSDRLASERGSFAGSSAMQIAGRSALAAAGLDNGADLVDVYSCFPSAVGLAVEALGLDATAPLTTWGGLCFAGGPWNNPVSHGLATMTERLRRGEGNTGLVTANGGIVHKHSFAVLAREPGDGFRHEDVTEAVRRADPGVRSVPEHHGPAVIEAYTVMHHRDGHPERAHAAAITPDGARVWALTSDSEIMQAMETDEWVGRTIEVNGNDLVG